MIKELKRRGEIKLVMPLILIMGTIYNLSKRVKKSTSHKSTFSKPLNSFMGSIYNLQSTIYNLQSADSLYWYQIYYLLNNTSKVSLNSSKNEKLWKNCGNYTPTHVRVGYNPTILQLANSASIMNSSSAIPC